MARITLITGGCRSGKSDYAQKLAESLPGQRAYVATCPVEDDEMRQRVEKHRCKRAGQGWDTIEEPLELAHVLNEDQHDVLLVDCLTLWVSNLMLQAEQTATCFGELEIETHAKNILACCSRRTGTVILVTNEVGLGIVPDNALARRYRDLVGRLNQTIACEADDVTLVTCGLPLHLKES